MRNCAHARTQSSHAHLIQMRAHMHTAHPVDPICDIQLKIFVVFYDALLDLS